MKTAISIPDRIFKAADKLARRLGISRSQLYASAVEQYLNEQDKAVLTDKMNRAIEAGGNPPLDPGFKTAQAKILNREAW